MDRKIQTLLDGGGFASEVQLTQHDEVNAVARETRATQWPQRRPGRHPRRPGRRPGMSVVIDASAVVAALIDGSEPGAWCAEQLTWAVRTGLA
ncbi:MAG TPA: hypothetical protein VK053_19240 [Jiangellaceae bacterium]|nr:hypothetical protein [Jiangellaceae bacterium]